jgi:hypothetical protein
LLAVAVKVTAVPTQTCEAGVAMLTVGAMLLLMLMLRPLEVTAPGWIQLPVPLTSGVITTVTTSVLVSVLLVYVAVLAPLTFTPFTLHWYVGLAPPLVGVAVKVTAAPEQTEAFGVVMRTLGVRLLLGVTLRLLEVTGAGLIQLPAPLR